MLVAVLFVIVKNWKPNVTLNEEWISKQWYIHPNNKV